MTLRLLLLFSLSWVACKIAGAPHKQESLPPEQRKSEVSPPQPAVTPQTIAKAMFPNAPEKTQNIDCFRALTPEMSMDSVIQKCGRPDEEVGSGIYIFVWHMPDGSTIAIGTPYLKRIYDVIYTAPSGKRSSLLRKQ
jgi:hypothetical protein